MSESTFSADLDALVRGELIASNDELTRFVTDLYGEEQNVTMPNALKLRIANDLGLAAANEPTTSAAPVSRRTMRSAEPPRRSSRPWAIAFVIAAAILLALTGILRWGMPTTNNEPDNHFLAAPTVVPTVAATPGVSPESNEWMIPYTEAECPEDELMDRAEWIQLQNERAASYRPDEQPADEPYSPANNEDSEAVVSRQRDAMACINRGDNPADRTDAALPIESPRRAWEWQVDPETNQAILEDRMERSKALSTWVEEEMGLTPSDLVYPTDDEVGLFWPPSHAIDLGDGRIALLPGWLMPDMEPLTSIEFNVPVWIEHNGEWLYEEDLFFCIGDCDDYWTQLESDISKLATPVASPESSPLIDQSWLQPVGIDDCPEGLLDPAQSMENPSGRHYSEEEYAAVSTDRAYGPYSIPSGNDAVEVAEAQRLYAACGWSTELTRPLWTARFEYERWTMSMDWASDSDAQELSAWYQDELGVTVDDVVFEVEMSEVGLDPAGPDHITVGYLPEHAVQLSDGRVAVPESQVTYRSEVATREYRPKFLLSTATVYVEMDGEWLLDEYIPICIGDCDQYWEQRASINRNQTTPVASPASSPVADRGWMQPITPEECVIEDSGELPGAAPEDFDAYPAREYTVVGPADPADAYAANDVARQYFACGYPPVLLSERAAIEAALSGDEFSPYSVVTLDRQLIDGIALSSQLQEHGVTLEDTVVPSNQDDIGEAGYVIPSPELTFALEDGRVVVMSVIVSSDSDGWIGTAMILTNEDGVWMVDDQVPLCIGQCDDTFSELESIYTNALWLMPISVEECERNAYLPADISESSAAAVKSRQYIACEMGGDSSPLQDPDHQLTEREDARPLSKEIESLHRANDQTPASLQRIAQTYLWSEDVELPTDPWTVFQPGSVVTLDDGRVAVLETTVVTPDGVAGSGRTSPVVTTALVWNIDGDSWLLDEEVTVCLGNCDSYWGDESVATPESTPVALVLPETCEATEEFAADFISSDRMVTIVRPGPGTGVQIGVLGFNTPLQYLCEAEETTNPTVDRMDAGKRWLLVRAEDGTEGWVREVDVRNLAP